MLTNTESAGGLVSDLIEPMFRELTGIAPAPPLPSPDAAARVPDPGRYVGRYESRVTAYDVTVDDAGRLWLAISARNEALTMYAMAGGTAAVQRYEVRPVDAEIFVLVDEAGNSVQAIEFFGDDRAEILHAGRAAYRV